MTHKTTTIRQMSLTLCTEYREQIERWASTVAGERVYMRISRQELNLLRASAHIPDSEGDELHMVLQGFRCVYHVSISPPCTAGLQRNMWVLSGTCLDGKHRSPRPGAQTVEMFLTSQHLLDELADH